MDHSLVWILGGIPVPRQRMPKVGAPRYFGMHRIESMCRTMKEFFGRALQRLSPHLLARRKQSSALVAAHIIRTAARYITRVRSPELTRTPSVFPPHRVR